MAEVTILIDTDTQRTSVSRYPEPGADLSAELRSAVLHILDEFSLSDQWVNAES